MIKKQLKHEEQKVKTLRKSSLRFGPDEGIADSVVMVTDVMVGLKKLSKSIRKKDDPAPSISSSNSTASTHRADIRISASPLEAAHADTVNKFDEISIDSMASVEKTSESTQEEGDHAQTQQPAFLLFDPEKVQEVVRGCIARNSEISPPNRKPTTAIISHGACFNTISRRKAKALGLPIRKLEDGDPREIYYLGDESPSHEIIGKVEAIWWYEDSQQSHPVDLFATEYRNHIFFGADFSYETRHIQPQGR